MRRKMPETAAAGYWRIRQFFVKFASFDVFHSKTRIVETRLGACHGAV